jgi:arsenate reductase (glutaredoxin)
MGLNIQIFGTKKCRETQKAIRFFKERRIPISYIDFTEKALSKGELENINRFVPLRDLVDWDGKQYNHRNLEYIIHNIEEEILNDPLLLKTPIVRNGKNGATVGYLPDKWLNWIKENK